MVQIRPLAPMKIWNRCDYCGRFISMDDFEKGRAQRFLSTPDSELSSEEYTTYHLSCHNKTIKAPAVYHGGHVWHFVPKN